MCLIKWRRLSITMGISGIIIAWCSALYAQSANVQGVANMNSGVSLSVVAWAATIAAMLVSGAAAINLALAKVSTQVQDHVCDKNIHPSRQDLDEIYMRRDLCQAQHDKQKE